mmetsp:Transcript_24121/g.58294  ORF Transcript_24121/g.58294 Transcript_24121/m.58294 type:complete len:220 (+) Transcript_24121:970-1629(+)
MFLQKNRHFQAQSHRRFPYPVLRHCFPHFSLSEVDDAHGRFQVDCVAGEHINVSSYRLGGLWWASILRASSPREVIVRVARTTKPTELVSTLGACHMVTSRRSLDEHPALWTVRAIPATRPSLEVLVAGIFAVFAGMVDIIAVETDGMSALSARGLARNIKQLLLFLGFLFVVLLLLAVSSRRIFGLEEHLLKCFNVYCSVGDDGGTKEHDAERQFVFL